MSNQANKQLLNDNLCNDLGGKEKMQEHIPHFQNKNTILQTTILFV